jgi:flagellar biosynthesis protein FlhA
MTDAAVPQSNRLTTKEVAGWLMRGEVALALGVLLIVVLLIVPIPTVILDLLLAVSIMSSVLILMTSLLIKKPLDFAIFPTVLLVATLFRLG